MHLDRRSFVLAAASSIVAAPALADPGASPGAFERPGTLIAFLQNMKRAAQDGLLLDQAFYAEANLKNVFGANYVVYGRLIDGIRTYGTVAGFGVLADLVRTGGGTREGMQLDFTLSAPENAAPEGNLRLSFLVPKRGFDDVEATFGKDWKPAAYTSPSTTRAPYATRNHGSSAISYGLGEGPPGRWMTFSFDARAQLELVTMVNH